MRERYKCTACERGFCSERSFTDHKHQSCCSTNAEIVTTEEQEEVVDETEIAIESKPTFIECRSEMEPNQLLSCDTVPSQSQIDIDVDEKPKCSRIETPSECTDEGKEYQCYLCNRK